MADASIDVETDGPPVPPGTWSCTLYQKGPYAMLTTCEKSRSQVCQPPSGDVGEGKPCTSGESYNTCGACTGGNYGPYSFYVQSCSCP